MTVSRRGRDSSQESASLAANLQAPVLYPVGTQNLEAPRRRWLNRLLELQAAGSQHLLGGVINTFAERLKNVCSRVKVKVVCCPFPT